MRLAVTVLLAMALLAVLATPAPAAIVPQRSISGIELDMTRQQVQARLGKPQAVGRVSSPFGRALRLSYRFGRLVVRIGENDRRVFSVETSSRRERTRSGVGPGSSEARVRSRLPGVQCDEGATPACWLGGSSSRHTIFRLDEGRVVSVDLRKTVGEQ
jgi:hypothetical protein